MGLCAGHSPWIRRYARYVRVICAGVCYFRVDVRGADAVQSEVNGTYTKVANLTHGSRPVYQRANSTTMYLFYRPRSSDWRIGSNFTSGTPVVASESEAALCPDQSTGWLAWSGDAWVGKDVAVDPARSLGHSLPPAPPARL